MTDELKEKLVYKLATYARYNIDAMLETRPEMRSNLIDASRRVRDEIIDMFIANQGECIWTLLYDPCHENEYWVTSCEKAFKFDGTPVNNIYCPACGKKLIEAIPTIAEILEETG